MFAKLVKIKLLEKDMTREQLCNILGCSTANLSQLLSGDNMREKTMHDIASALGCNLTISLTDKE